MQKTKIAIALVALAAVALIAISLASAQIAATQTPNPTTGTAQIGGFWGWMGRCFGFGGAQYTATQAQTSGNQPLNITVTDPNTNTTTTYQVYPGYGMPYYANQPQSQPQNITVTNPNTGATTTYQSYIGNGVRGGCMGRLW
jgi:hypothetical protein